MKHNRSATLWPKCERTVGELRCAHPARYRVYTVDEEECELVCQACYDAELETFEGTRSVIPLPNYNYVFGEAEGDPEDSMPF